MSKLIPKAYQFRFYPQDDLKIILAKTFGSVRFVYNKTLDFSEKHYAQKDKIDNYKNLTGTDRVNFVTELKNTLEEEIEKDSIEKSSSYIKKAHQMLYEVSK